MSSLLQFQGQVSRKGVRLEFIQTRQGEAPIPELPTYRRTEDTDGICLPGGKWLPRIWTCYRKPKGMFGCWVVFRYNNSDQVPDLSCPISTDKLPKDARPLPIAECIAAWKRNHYDKSNVEAKARYVRPLGRT